MFKNLIMNADFLAFVGSVALLSIYHIRLRLKLRNDPRYTVQAINNAGRASWVNYIMSNPNKDILGVQTLRNSTMAATFLASTAILLIIGVLNLTQKGGISSLVLHATAETPASGDLLHLLKLVPLLLDLFAAFFFFSLAVRNYNHTGFLLNAAGHPAPMADQQYVARFLNRGGSYFSLGMRSYYLAVPFLFWLFSPYLMMGVSILLLFVLHHVDRPPLDSKIITDDLEFGESKLQLTPPKGFRGNKAA